jgi:hypothetical protein
MDKELLFKNIGQAGVIAILLPLIFFAAIIILIAWAAAGAGAAAGFAIAFGLLGWASFKILMKLKRR